MEGETALIELESNITDRGPPDESLGAEVSSTEFSTLSKVLEGLPGPRGP